MGEYWQTPAEAEGLYIRIWGERESERGDCEHNLKTTLRFYIDLYLAVLYVITDPHEFLL